MQKIVTIGGGTGHYQILRGLKNYECEITAIVNMADDGGSSGILRDEYGVLPPGDARQCLLALADEDESETLRYLFNYRFNGEKIHNLGNLIITALSEKYGPAIAIKEAGKILNIKGKVLPVTIDNVKLYAELSNKEIIQGESNISNPEKINSEIKRLFCEPKPFLYKEVAKSISEADKIIICPGDLYGSIIPNLIVSGMSDALKNSKAKKIYICNLFTKGYTSNFKASDFLNEIEKYAEIKMDYILLNSGKPSEETLKKYNSENSSLVENNLSNTPNIILGEFVREYPSERKTLFRHIPEKIARQIISI